MMQIRQLKYFIAVAEDGHFSRAAARLDVSQSTVSEQIRKLETELDAELLMRTSRKVTLTPAGGAFLTGARKILLELAHLESVVHSHARGELGCLRIGAVGPALNAAVPQVLRRLAKTAPGIEISLTTMSTEQQVDALLRGEIEAGFVRGVRSRSGLRVETITEEKLWAVFPRGHRLAGEPDLDLSQLTGETFVFWPRAANSALYDQIISTCNQHGCIPGRMVEGNDRQTQLALISAGQGVSVQPQSFRDHNRDDLVFLPLRGPVRPVALQFAWCPAYETPAMRVLLGAARSVRAGQIDRSIRSL